MRQMIVALCLVATPTIAAEFGDPDADLGAEKRNYSNLGYASAGELVCEGEKFALPEYGKLSVALLGGNLPDYFPAKAAFRIGFWHFNKDYDAAPASACLNAIATGLLKER